MGRCCSSNRLCTEGQGHCDNDRECFGNLVCGRKNCGSKFTWSGANCCKKSEGMNYIWNRNLETGKEYTYY